MNELIATDHVLRFCLRAVRQRAFQVQLALLVLLCAGVTAFGQTDGPKRIAYIHGDIAADGTLPSGEKPAYHKMLLTDSGKTGLSQFREMVEAEGYVIEQYYDRETTLDQAFLEKHAVLIFGLHQKLWSEAEKEALDSWLKAGGGMLIYSDSASGGHFGQVGAQNPVGQRVVNNLITQYGMQVTRDQANGVKAYRADPDEPHPLMKGRPVLEGEGVSPVAIHPESGARALIPYRDDPRNKVHGAPHIRNREGVTFESPQFAALALRTVGKGHVIVMFDRQPMWNGGPGSDIGKRDNKEILRRVIRFLGPTRRTR